MEKYLKFEDRAQLYESVVKTLNLEKVGEYCYPADGTGSYFITFSAGSFLIRYDNSRYGNGSELNIQVASNTAPSKWRPLSIIKSYINECDEINPNHGLDLKSIQELNSFLITDCDKVAELLNEHNYQAAFSHIDVLLKEEFEKKMPGAVRK